MSDFYSRKPTPVSHIVFYGALAAIGVALIGYFSHDEGLYIVAAICGFIVGGIGFIFSWIRSSVKSVPSAQGQSHRFPRWIYWVFWIALLSSSFVKIWLMMHKG